MMLQKAGKGGMPLGSLLDAPCALKLFSWLQGGPCCSCRREGGVGEKCGISHSRFLSF